MEVGEDEKATLHCEAKGYPAPEIHFRKVNGQDKRLGGHSVKRGKSKYLIYSNLE